jgi:hypothetical protein
MTVDDLKRVAGRSMASMKAQIEERHQLEPLCMLHWPLMPARMKIPRMAAMAVTPGEWSRFPFPGQLLDSGDAKRVLFGIIRDLVGDTGADGVLFGTDMWGAQATEAGIKAGSDAWNRHVDTGFAKLVKMGWAIQVQLLNVTVQSKTDVLMMQHAYQRKGSGLVQWIGAAHSSVIAQDGFGGRQKMFGDLREENLGEPPQDSPAEKHQKGGA